MTERAPLGPLRHLSEGTRVQRTGGALHAVANASPIPSRTSAVADALSSLAEASERTSKVDQFVLAADGAQDLSLSFLPVEDSWNVMVRRLAAFDGDDFTISGQTLSLIDGDLAPVTGDKVRIQYDYYTGVPTTMNTEWVDTVTGLGPLAWYRLDDVSNGGTMTDSSGHGHHGAWNGVTTHSLTTSLVPSDPDGALSMTGAGGEGAHVTSAAWMNLTSNLSWLIFFKTTDTAARLFAREQTSGGGQDWSLQVGNNVFFCAGGSVVATSVDNTLSDDAMHMAVFTYDGSNVRIYIDGAIDKTQAYSTPLGTSAQDILIGYGGGIASGHMFAGTLDEAIIFDQVLSGADVTALWNAAQ